MEPRNNLVLAFKTATVVLLLCCALLIWKTLRLRRELALRGPGSNPLALQSTLPKLFPARRGIGVLFVFKATDCAACLTELNDLESFAKNQPGIQLAGLLEYGSDDEAMQTEHNFTLSFPVLADPQGTLTRSLQVPATPWTVVVNLSDGRIVYEGLPASSPEQREAAI